MKKIILTTAASLGLVAFSQAVTVHGVGNAAIGDVTTGWTAVAGALLGSITAADSFTSSTINGSVDDVDFTYQVRITTVDTSVAQTAQLDFRNSGDGFVLNTGASNNEFSPEFGLTFEIINLTDTGGTANTTLDASFDGFVSFASGNVSGADRNWAVTNSSNDTLNFVGGGSAKTSSANDVDSTTLLAHTSGDDFLSFVADGEDDGDFRNIQFQFSTTTAAVPEPSSTALFSLGGLALILRRRK